jgi:hypothetical protein
MRRESMSSASMSRMVDVEASRAGDDGLCGEAAASRPSA